PRTRTPAPASGGTDASPGQFAAHQPHQVQLTAISNATCERFVGTVRRECLDWILIANPRHLRRVLAEFVDHYNRHRPHRALGLAPPEPRWRAPPARIPPAASIRRHDRLGGLIHEYTIVA
ncbi:MAG: integrase core domain-containing protein, partial [Solirubrobacterales bacterium]